MANSTRQVHQDSVSAQLAELLAVLEKERHPFRAAPHANRRRYPAEGEGRYLVEYLNAGSASKHSSLLESLRVIQGLAQAAKDQDVAAVHRLRKSKRGMKFAYGYLAKMAASRLKEMMIDVHEDGLILHPTRAEAKAALAVLVLDKKRRIDRIKKCLCCGVWFFARFKHQKFCSDPKKECQWNHYHTPEWRRQHREQNKMHQRAYRGRLFGKPSKRSPAQ